MYSTLRTKTRIKPVSDKRRATFPAREKCVRIVKKRDGYKCRVCGEDGYDVHEILTRAQGGDPTDPDNAVLLCREHHDFAHNHPKWAAEVGLIQSKKHGR